DQERQASGDRQAVHELGADRRRPEAVRQHRAQPDAAERRQPGLRQEPAAPGDQAALGYATAGLLFEDRRVPVHSGSEVAGLSGPMTGMPRWRPWPGRVLSARGIGLILALVIIAVIVIPVAMVAAGSFWSAPFIRQHGHVTLRNYTEFLSDPRTPELLL